MRNDKRIGTATAWLLATALVVGLPQLASAQTVLRIGMTAADIPRTLGQPDQGFEGNRFTGLTMYDALTMWDLSSADKPSVMIPGLATEWKADDAVGDQDRRHDGGIDHQGARQLPADQSHQPFHGEPSAMAKTVCRS